MSSIRPTRKSTSWLTALRPPRVETPCGEIETLVARAAYREVDQLKEAALRTCIKAGCGDRVLIQDADLDHHPAGYAHLPASIFADQADVVFGPRFLGRTPYRTLRFWHRVGDGVLIVPPNVATKINLIDLGICRKAFRHEIIRAMEIDERRFAFDPVITAQVAKSRCPSSAVPRQSPTDVDVAQERPLR